MNWIVFIKEDENKALREIYTLYREECMAWIRREYRLDDTQCMEAFQNGVVLLYDNVITGKLTELTSGLKTYLFAIVKNKIREEGRKQKKVTHVEHDSLLLNTIVEDSNVEDKIALEKSIVSVNAALEDLGDPCKSLLQLFYYKQLKMADICTLLGYKNTDTVKNQKYKCIKRLQKMY